MCAPSPREGIATNCARISTRPVRCRNAGSVRANSVGRETAGDSPGPSRPVGLGPWDRPEQCSRRGGFFVRPEFNVSEVPRLNVVLLDRPVRARNRHQVLSNQNWRRSCKLRARALYRATLDLCIPCTQAASDLPAAYPRMPRQRRQLRACLPRRRPELIEWTDLHPSVARTCSRISRRHREILRRIRFTLLNQSPLRVA